VGKDNAREVFLNDDFSFTKAIADKFDVAGMFGIKNVEKYDLLNTIITRSLTPNLNVFNNRINEQVGYWRHLYTKLCFFFKKNFVADVDYARQIGWSCYW
jgi:hypothetical protein